MEQQFKILLPDSRPKLQLVAGGFVVLYGLPFALLFIFARLHYQLGIVITTLLLVLLIVATFWLPRLIRKLTYAPHLVTVTTENLSILNQKTGGEHFVSFADIATYRFIASKSGAQIYFRFKDGHKHLISSNDYSLFEIAPALNQAIKSYNRQHNFPDSERSATFFGHPVATGFLVFYAIILGLLIWNVGIPDFNKAGFFGLFILGFGFILYVIAWYESREERRNY